MPLPGLALRHHGVAIDGRQKCRRRAPRTTHGFWSSLWWVRLILVWRGQAAALCVTGRQERAPHPTGSQPTGSLVNTINLIRRATLLLESQADRNCGAPQPAGQPVFKPGAPLLDCNTNFCLLLTFFGTSSSRYARTIFFGSSPGALHMRTRGLGYTAGAKGAEELVPLGASRWPGADERLQNCVLRPRFLFL